MNTKQRANNPCLSLPIEVGGEIYDLNSTPMNPESTNYQQAWNGYKPECTLENKAECQLVPIQTANIKHKNLYRAIEIEGDKWMKLACETAKNSVIEKGGPFGAIVLQIDSETNEIIRYWTNHNQVTSTNDPTAHAEIMTIRSACKSLGVFKLDEIKKEDSQLSQPGELSHCIIYSSTEPCPMCYSAICWAKIPALFFAATRFDSGVKGVDFSDEEIYNELAKPYAERKMIIYQCTTDNSLDAFNLWKRTPNIKY